jgi:hypothetical protein
VGGNVANKGNQWDGFDPEFALLGGVLKQAVKDALQTANESLHRDAWQFLEICAPTVAEKLRKGLTHGKPV